MSERKKATKAIAISRVSSKEQEEGYSIDAQKRRLEEYCMRKGLELIKVFELIESSTVGSRAKFMEALKFAKEHKEIIAVITDKVDRLQRGFKESPLLNELIDKEKIELHFHVENCVIHKYSTSNEKFMWNMNVVMAQNYVDSLRDNVNRSIEQKLLCGEWISTAPIGYSHIQGSRRQGTIVVDQSRAPLIRRLFEEYATGVCTISQKGSAASERDYYKTRISELNKELNSIKCKIDKLMDFFLEDKISEKEHDDKRAQLITRREKIMDELDAHNNADDSFNDTIIDVLKLASNAHEIFRLSTNDKKRKLINLVLSTVKLNGQKLDYTLRPPFDAFVNLDKNKEWRALVYSLLTRRQEIMLIL